MLHFQNLSKLDTHLNFLNKKMLAPSLDAGNNQNLFLVGGCIRDLLLDIEENPTDIDLTLAGNPKDIYENIDKEGLSHFMTEKFGTITLIKKPSKEKESLYQYEITPLRTEGGYEDSRHPGEIHRSNDLVLDSDRRDFTFNCIYYSVQTLHATSQQKITTPKKAKSTDTINHTSTKEKINTEKFVKLLEKHGFIFIQDLNLYIIQDHNYISKLFKNGQFQSDFLPYLQNITKENVIFSAPLSAGEGLGVREKIQNLKFIIDPHKGIQDLINKKIKTVGNADTRFNEDALRILRALRIVNILNMKLRNYYSKHAIRSNHFFDYDRETRQSTKRNAHLVKKVAKERIKDELTKAFIHDNPFGFVALLDEIKLLEYIFPALYETKHIEQPTRYHPFDIYTHSMLALYEIQKINTDPLVKFAVLYHDVGKVGQFDSYKGDLSKEEIREILAGPSNHRRSGPELTKKDFSRLGFSNKETEDIARYVSQHHRPEEFLGAKDEHKTKKLRKFLSEAGYERALNVLDVCIADRMGQYNPLQSINDVGDVYEAVGQLNILQESEGQFTMKDLAIKGDDLIKKFKLAPGPNIGDYLKDAFNRVIDDISNKNNKKAIFEYLKGIMDE